MLTSILPSPDMSMLLFREIHGPGTDPVVAVSSPLRPVELVLESVDPGVGGLTVGALLLHRRHLLPQVGDEFGVSGHHSLIMRRIRCDPAHKG